MVLFLFVVMMLDINIDSIRQGFWKHFPAAGIIGAVIAVEMAFVLTRGFDLPVAKAFPPDVAKLPNAKALGIELFTHYLYPIQIAALILLVAIVAAIALTLRQRKDSRSQSPSEQVRVRKADRLRVVKVAPQVEAPVAAEAAQQPGGPA
jgi:NADH-quinone oxidoreductase subunit J